MSASTTSGAARGRVMPDDAARSAQAPAMPRPRWSVLYGVIALAAGTLLTAELAFPPGAARTALDLGIAWGAFAVIAVWLRGQRAARDLQAWCDCASARTTVRVIEFRTEDLARDGKDDLADSPARPAAAAPSPWRATAGEAPGDGKRGALEEPHATGCGHSLTGGVAGPQPVADDPGRAPYNDARGRR